MIKTSKFVLHNLDMISFELIVALQAGEVTIAVSIWTVDDEHYSINCDCLVTSSFLTTKNNCSTCSRFILRNRFYMTRVGCKNEIGMNESDNNMISNNALGV